MACNCGTRAERLLKRLGYQEVVMGQDEVFYVLPTTGYSVARAELRRHHFRQTLRALWKFLFQ